MLLEYINARKSQADLSPMLEPHYGRNAVLPKWQLPFSMTGSSSCTSRRQVAPHLSTDCLGQNLPLEVPCNYQSSQQKPNTDWTELTKCVRLWENCPGGQGSTPKRANTFPTDEANLHGRQ